MSVRTTGDREQLLLDLEFGEDDRCGKRGSMLKVLNRAAAHPDLPKQAVEALRATDEKAWDKSYCKVTDYQLAQQAGWKRGKRADRTARKWCRYLIRKELLAEEKIGSQYIDDPYRRDAEGRDTETIHRLWIQWSKLVDLVCEQPSHDAERCRETASKRRKTASKCSKTAARCRKTTSYYIDTRDTRSYAEGGRDESSPSAAADPPQEPPEAELIDQIEVDLAEAWNSVPGICHFRLPLSEKRRKALRARLKERDFSEGWREAIERIRDIPFFRGHNSRGWKATIDFFLRPDSVTKILEGQYDSDRSPTAIDQNKWNDFMEGENES